MIAATRMLSVWSSENERQKYICTKEHRDLASSLEQSLRGELGELCFSEEWQGASRLQPFEVIEASVQCSGSK